MQKKVPFCKCEIKLLLLLVKFTSPRGNYLLVELGEAVGLSLQRQCATACPESSFDASSITPDFLFPVSNIDHFLSPVVAHILGIPGVLNHTSLLHIFLCTKFSDTEWLGVTGSLLKNNEWHITCPFSLEKLALHSQ